MVAPDGTAHVYEVAPEVAVMEYPIPETPAGIVLAPEIAPGIAGVLVVTVIDTLLVPPEPQAITAVTDKFPLAVPQA